MDQKTIFMKHQRDISEKYNVSVGICKIIKVNTDTLTVDVQVFDTSAKLYNVPICFPNRGIGFGSYFMPREGSTHLLLNSTRGKPYLMSGVITGEPQYVSIADIIEKLMPGENLIQSSGKAFMKQDLSGNSISSSSVGNYVSQHSSGVNSDMSNGKIENDISSSKISGVGFDRDLVSLRTALGSGNIKLSNKTEYYSSVSFPKTYDADSIMDNDYNIDESVKSSIISDAESIIAKVNGSSSFIGLKDRLSDFYSEMKSMSISEAHNYMSQVKTDLQNDFSLNRAGTKITTEIGNVFTDPIDSPNDILKMTDSNVEKSEAGNNLCFKFDVKNGAGDTVASISIDDDGNLYIKAKSINYI